MNIWTKIRSLITRRPALEITFTPETPKQKEKALSRPWWESSYADQAKKLIADEAIRRGKVSPFERDERGFQVANYGSGWYIEFPRYVAILIEKEGLEAAEKYVAWTFDEGTSRDAADQLMKMNPDENFCVAYFG